MYIKNKKKILFLTFGSKGDVLPYLELSKILSKKGFLCSIATSSQYKKIITSCQIGYIEIKNNIFDRKKLIYKSESEFIKNISNEDSRGKLAFYFECLDKVIGYNIIFYNNLGFIGRHIGEYLKMPAIALPFQPILRSWYYSLFFKCNIKTINYLSHRYSEYLFWKQFRDSINLFRGSLNMPKIKFWGHFTNDIRKKYPFFFLFSKYLFPKPLDWHGNVKIIGNIRIMNKYEKFDSKDAIVIYFGPVRDMKINSIIKEIEINFEKKILVVGIKGKNTSKITFKNQVDLEYAIKDCYHFIHHGGSGTTHLATRMGIKQTIIPFFGDQFLWARQLKKLGLIKDYLNAKKIKRMNVTKLIKNNEKIDNEIRLNYRNKINKEKSEDNFINALNMVFSYENNN